MRDIALYGRSGSGKTTIASALAVQHGYQHLRTGVACRSLCRDLFDSEAKTLMNQVTEALRSIDPSVWLRAALRDRGDGPAVFDSMRFPQDYVYLKDRGFLLVRVDADIAARVERLALRGQTFDPVTDDLHAAEVSLDTFDFDVEIDNGGSQEDLLAQIVRLTDGT